MASAKMYPSPEMVPAAEPGTKNAWARLDREIIQNAIDRSECLPERVWLFLILTSACGPTVRDGCYLRDRRGYTIKDKNGEEIPVRPRDICEALEVPDRRYVWKAMRRLMDQNRLLPVKDGVLYPVLSPATLAELVESVSQIDSVSETSDVSYPTHILGIRIPAELYAASPVSVSETVEELEKIRQEFETEHARLQKQYRDRLKQAISDRRILIDEKREEIREDIESSSSSVEYVPLEEMTTTTTGEPPPEPSPEPETPEPADVSPVVEAAKEVHHIHLTAEEAREMVTACREKLRDAAVTPEEVARFVFTVDPIRREGTVRSPRRFLRTAVLNRMTPDELRILRREWSPPASPCTQAYADPVVSSVRCMKCGGMTVKYQSGQVSLCRCESEKQTKQRSREPAWLERARRIAAGEDVS